MKSTVKQALYTAEMMALFDPPSQPCPPPLIFVRRGERGSLVVILGEETWELLHMGNATNPFDDQLVFPGSYDRHPGLDRKSLLDICRTRFERVERKCRLEAGHYLVNNGTHQVLKCRSRWEVYRFADQSASPWRTFSSLERATQWCETWNRPLSLWLGESP